LYACGRLEPCIHTGEDSPAAYRTWYRLAVGVWIMVALLWFGGVFSAVRKLLKYDEISEPFRINDDEEFCDDDPKHVRTATSIADSKRRRRCRINLANLTRTP